MDVLRFAFVLLIGLLTIGSAQAGKRVALVIGNSTYQKVPSLPNPINDAATLAAMFRAANFDSVESKYDLSVADLRRTLRDFAIVTREAEIAVVYYAGHGIELDGMNYLVPVDAALEADGDVLDETVSLDRVLFAVEPAKKLRLVILDACRDNPFLNRMKRTVATRGLWRGLAKVEPATPNTLIAFAAKAGFTASDGDSKNSPFAVALEEFLPKPGLDVRRALGFVRDHVLQSTNGKQEPYVYGSLGGEDVALVPAKPSTTGPQADPQAAVRRDYEFAIQLATREGWQTFLSQYPQGFYSNLAKGQLSKIAAEEARAAAAERARLAELERDRLALQGAVAAELAKAMAAAQSAERARVATEEANRIAKENVALDEKPRIADQETAKLPDKAPPQDQRTETSPDKNSKFAALTSPTGQQATLDLIVSLQDELRRVGCNRGAVDGDWNAASYQALDLFNKHAGTQFDIVVASAEALKAVQRTVGRVCPPVCDSGFRATSSGCEKIYCPPGYHLSESGSCARIETNKPTAKRGRALPKKEQTGSEKNERIPAKPQASGQVICDQSGCRPVKPGCRLASNTKGFGYASASWQREVCN